MTKIVTEYFTNIFTSKGVSPGNCDEILECIHPRITKEKNAELLRPFMANEVKETVFSMEPLKALGKD